MLDIPMVRNTVRILGCVMMPSVISYQSGKSAKSYINDCGGFAARAQKGKAYVVHMNGSSEKIGLATRVRPGDEIVVPQRQKTEGMSDKAFERTTQAISALASLSTVVTYVYLIAIRN